MEENAKQALERFLSIAHTRPLTEEELDEFNALNARGGFDALLGVRYTHVAHSRVDAVVRIGPHVHQPWGVANGGVYCSISESVASLAGVIAAGQPVVGVHNSTNFIRPVSQGVLEATARPIQLGKRTQLWEVSLNHDGKLVATTQLRTMPL